MTTTNSNFVGGNGYYQMAYDNNSTGIVTGGIGAGSAVTWVMQTPAGDSVKLEAPKGKGDINPRLYFSFVKSKLSKNEQAVLKPKLMKLKKLIVTSKEMGQQGLYEQYCTMAAVVMREQEAVVCGVDRWIDRENVNKFMHRVEDRPIKFTLLEEFPRPIPKKVRERIKEVKAKKLFDRLHVLFIDHTKEDTRSTKEKIKNKDPILFGSYLYQPDRLYFIIDWIDEYCDLTIDKVVTKLKENDEEFALTEIPDIDEKALDEIRSEVEKRFQRLQETNSSNWREKVREEEVEKIRAEEKEKVRKELLAQAEALEKKHGKKANPIAALFKKVLGGASET